MNYDLNLLWQSMVKVLDDDSKTIGSGFVIQSDGYIITCHHVIYRLNVICVEYQGQKHEAFWCENLSNIEVDIAILKINVNDAKRVSIAFPKDQLTATMVYGFPRDKIEQFSKGFDVYGTLSQSPPINTLSTYKGFPDVSQTNLWNKKPRENSTFLAYRINERVSSGISGGLVLDRESGCAIGVIQAGGGGESYAISWNNIIDKLKELSINPSANDKIVDENLLLYYRLKSEEFIYESYARSGYIDLRCEETLKELRETLDFLPAQTQYIESEVIQNYLSANEKLEKNISRYQRHVLGIMQNKSLLSDEDREFIKERQEAIGIENEPAGITFSLLGNELIRQGNLVKASVYFKESIRLNGADPSAYVGLGTILYIQGCINEAMKILDMAENLYQLQPKLAKQHNELKELIQHISKKRGENIIVESLKRLFQ